MTNMTMPSVQAASTLFGKTIYQRIQRQSSRPNPFVFPELAPKPPRANTQDVYTPSHPHQADVLVILAHPDDEMLMAGTLSLLAQKGVSIQTAYLTSGDAGKNLLHIPNSTPLAVIREKELAQALKIMGIQRLPVMLHYPDGSIENHQTEIQADIATLIDSYRPKVVLSFGPEGVTRHPDHRNLSNDISAVLKQTKTSEPATKPAFYQVELPNNLPKRLKERLTKLSGWQDTYFHPKDYQDVLVNIGPKADLTPKNSPRGQKLAVLEAHQSQFSPAFKNLMHLMTKEKPLEVFHKAT